MSRHTCEYSNSIIPCRRIYLAVVLWCVFSTGILLGAPPHNSGEKFRSPFEEEKEIELLTPDLRMERIKLRCPELEILDFTGKEKYGMEQDWSIEEKKVEEEEGVFALTLSTQKRRVERTVEYLLFKGKLETHPQQEKVEGTWPLWATERARDLDSGKLLFRRQSLDFSLYLPLEEKERGPHRKQALLLALNKPERLVCVDTIDILTDFLWHRQHLDSPPGSYNGILELLNRRIELDPMEPSQYADAAWLWWSKWVSWKQNPERMPDGEVGIDKAFDLLHKGRSANPENAHYLFDAAMNIQPLARFHLPEKYDFVESYLLEAEKYAEEEEEAFRIRLRRSIAHLYRLTDRNEEAIQWYRKVLEIDPEDEVAKRYLKQLIGNDAF